MANPKQAAFENLQRMSAMLRDIIAVGPDLAKIGSLEQATAEAQSKLADTRAQVEADCAAARAKGAKDIAAAEAACKARCAELDKQQADALAAVSAATAKADDIIAAAKVQGGKIVADANSVAAAKANAVAAASARLDALNQSIVLVDTELTNWREKTALAQAEHDRIVGLIAALKAKL